MAALIVLAAVTLPSLKSLLHDQKVTSASRMVLAHFQAAQARAIAGNSPVAVILERTVNESSPNAVSRLSIGQVFPPYEGDTTGTMGTLSSVGGTFYDTLTVNVAEASLLNRTQFGVFLGRAITCNSTIGRASICLMSTTDSSNSPVYPWLLDKIRQ